jgi:sulfur carrier protein
MQICLNGVSQSVDENTTIDALLQNLQITGRLAVEVNREIIPRSEHARYALQESDQVEIVHAIGGG